MVDLYSSCKNETLKLGSTGQCVKYAMQKLQDWGFYKAKNDGWYGPIMKAAVISFQKKTRHSPDGVLGPKTWSSFPTYQVKKPGVLKGDEWVLAEMRKLGPVNSLRDFRNVVAKFFSYLYYYDQRQTQDQTVKTRKGNCADLINDVGLPVARALKLKAKGVHCQVKCSDGYWYGHYIMEVEGVLCDVAAWAKGKAYGTLICTGGYDFLHYEGDYIP